MADHCSSCALRHETPLLYDRHDVGQICLRAYLQVRPKAFLNDVVPLFAASEHPK